MKCTHCSGTMQPTSIILKGIAFDGWGCTKCKEKIFTEKQSLTVVRRLDQQRLSQDYIKHPMKIGRSWGMTFPKELADVFNLNEKKTKMRLIPYVSEGKIIIEIEE
ncbi:MAG: hypothetical protein ABIJ21_07430 [Nanoarchaeota archaeon]